MTKLLSRTYQFLFPTSWGDYQRSAIYSKYQQPRRIIWLDYLISVSNIIFGLMAFSTYNPIIGNLLLTVGMAGLLEVLYWDYKSRTFKKYQKGSYMKDIYECLDNHEKSLKPNFGAENVQIAVRPDITFNLRNRPPGRTHTTRIVQALERAEEGKMMKVIGDDRLSLEAVELCCKSTDCVLEGWYRREDGCLNAYIRIVKEARLGGKYDDLFYQVLETGEFPHEEPELVSYIWGWIRSTPTYLRRPVYDWVYW